MSQYYDLILKFYKKIKKRRFRDEMQINVNNINMKDNADDWYNGKVDDDPEKINNNSKQFGVILVRQKTIFVLCDVYVCSLWQ